MGKLDPKDLYAIRDLLTDEKRMARKTVTRFMDEKALPLIPEALEKARFPRELIPEMAELRLLGHHFDNYDLTDIQDNVTHFIHLGGIAGNPWNGRQRRTLLLGRMP